MQLIVISQNNTGLHYKFCLYPPTIKAVNGLFQKGYGMEGTGNGKALPKVLTA